MVKIVKIQRYFDELYLNDKSDRRSDGPRTTQSFHALFTLEVSEIKQTQSVSHFSLSI